MSLMVKLIDTVIKTLFINKQHIQEGRGRFE